MADQITNYQCPACTGPLHFSGKTGKLECEYCGKSYDAAEIEALYAEKEEKAARAMQQEEGKKQAAAAADREDESWDMSDMTGDWGEDAKGMKVYSCPSCGAELICDETTAATSCPYCGNPTVVPGQFSGSLKPEYVIPFRLSKEDAIQALKEHYKGKIFLPKSFSWRCRRSIRLRIHSAHPSQKIIKVKHRNSIMQCLRKTDNILFRTGWKIPCWSRGRTAGCCRFFGAIIKILAARME